MPFRRKDQPSGYQPDAHEGHWGDSREASREIRRGLKHAGLSTRRHRFIILGRMISKLLEAIGKADLSGMGGVPPHSDEE